MKYYAEINNGIVAQTIETEFDIKELYHPDFIKTLIECGNDVQEGWLYDGKVFTQPTIQQPDLSFIQETLNTQIDQDAETDRLRYITPGVGQSMTYQEKVNQAAQYSKAYTAYKADPQNAPEPNANEYLLLASGLGIDGDTLIEAAETVTFAYAQWQYIGAAIETMRLKAKLAIDEAKTVETAQAIYDGIQWPQV